MTRRQVLLTAITVAAALVASVVLLVRRPDDVRITASSGSDPSRLVSAAQRSEGSPTADVPRNVAWRTATETVGSWIQISFPEPTRVEHVEVRGAGRFATGFTSAVLMFDGGGSLMLTANRAGDASVTFPGRTVSSARLTIAEVPPGAGSVALAGFSVDRFRHWSSDPGAGRRMVAATSSSTGSRASALADGRPADGDTGSEWTASPDDPAPWAQLSWASPREVASVQIFGPGLGPPDATPVPADAPLSGILRFSDGSVVIASGIARGTGPATTIAFTPRVASSVRLQIDRSQAGTAVGLRELAVYDSGTTPPRWPSHDHTYSVSPPSAGTCGRSSRPVATPASGRLTLVCPAPGSAVAGRVTVVVAADPQTSVQALAWSGTDGRGDGSADVVASAHAGSDGRAALSVDVTDLPRGPLTLGIRAGVQDRGIPLWVQLINQTGRPVKATGYSPAGMTRQWDEEFDDPVSITSTGAGADYAATKPDPSGGSQFGEAAFADPASGAGTLATVTGGYLRIRARPADDSGTTGMGYLAGLLSSAHVGGSGFAAQYAYFEARVMGAPGRGAWSAFWMLNSESAARQSGTAAEVDAVELYGHSTLGSCQTVHNWGSSPPLEPRASAPACRDPNGFSDWAMTWHTYGVRIAPDSVTFSIDGQITSTVSGLSHDSEPFFFMLDLALGGGWPIDLTSTANTSDLYVDWVRVYT